MPPQALGRGGSEAQTLCRAARGASRRSGRRRCSRGRPPPTRASSPTAPATGSSTSSPHRCSAQRSSQRLSLGRSPRALVGVCSGGRQKRMRSPSPRISCARQWRAISPRKTGSSSQLKRTPRSSVRSSGTTSARSHPSGHSIGSGCVRGAAVSGSDGGACGSGRRRHESGGARDRHDRGNLRRHLVADGDGLWHEAMHRLGLCAPTPRA